MLRYDGLPVALVFCLGLGLGMYGAAVSKAGRVTRDIQITPPLGLKFGSSPAQVRKKCKDLKQLDGAAGVYGSMKCSNRFTPHGAYQKMGFRFRGEPRELRNVQIYEPHENRQATHRRRAFFRRKYTNLYGPPKVRNCTYRNGKRTKDCAYYRWAKTITKLVMVVSEQPDKDIHGIYFLWSTR